MSKPARITAGITCYQAEETIGRAVASAQAQTWPDMEILVVDDASTDNSVEIVQSMAAKDPRIRLMRHTHNSGPGAARSTLVESATGAFIAFFDDDDTSAPNRLAVQHVRLEGFKRANGDLPAVCYASGSRRYPNGYELALPAIGSMPPEPKGEEVSNYLLFGARRAEVFYGAGTPTCALMAPVDLIKRAGNFDPNLRRVEDIDLAIRLARAGTTFLGCPESLFLQYATTGSDKTAEANRDAELSLMDKYADYLRERKKLGFAKTLVHLRYLHFTGQKFAFAMEFIRACLAHPRSFPAHALTTYPKRFLHERRMSSEG